MVQVGSVWIVFALNTDSGFLVFWMRMPVVAVLVDFAPIKYSCIAPWVEDKPVFKRLICGNDGDTAMFSKPTIIADCPGYAEFFQL